MPFFESLRTAVGRYAAGVHYLAPSASERTLVTAEKRLDSRLPTSYRDLLQSFDGLTLFHESLRLFPVAEVARAAEKPEYLRVGETPDGVLYLSLDGDGRLYLVDEEAPDPILVGSDIETWLDATLAREGLLVDREGEFRDVFTDDGLSVAIRRKRAQVGHRRDPRAALYLMEQAELSCEADDTAAAMMLLRQAVANDPQAGPAWELLATLYLDTDQTEAGEQAALFAAQATWHPPLRTARQLLATRIRTRNALRVL